MTARFPFRRCGVDATIHEWVRLLGAEETVVGDHLLVDDFAFLDLRGGGSIGDYVHIASFVSIAGGGRVALGDCVGLAAGARLVTGTDLPDGDGLLGPKIPADLRAVHRGFVTVEDCAVVMTNAVVSVDVTVGEGAILGAGAVATRDVEPWTINLGVPARPVRERPRDAVLARLAQLRARRGAAG